MSEIGLCIYKSFSMMAGDMVLPLPDPSSASRTLPRVARFSTTFTRWIRFWEPFTSSPGPHSSKTSCRSTSESASVLGVAHREEAPETHLLLLPCLHKKTRSQELVCCMRLGLQAKKSYTARHSALKPCRCRLFGTLHTIANRWDSSACNRSFSLEREGRG